MTRRRSLVLVLVLGCAHENRSSTATSTTTSTSLISGWSLEGLHVTGAPQVDREIGKGLEAYDDAIGYRMLDVASAGALVEHGGELEWIQRPGGPPIALTPYDFDIEWAQFVESRAVFTSDRDGDEHMAFYRRILARQGAPETAHVEHSQVFDPIVAPDGVVWWSERGQDGTWRLESWNAHSIAPGPGRWTLLDFTRDATALARRDRDDGTSALFTIDLTGGTASPVADGRAGGFGANGVVYAVSNAGELVRIDGVNGRSVVARSATQVAVARDGSMVAFVADDDGAATLRLYDVTTATTRDAAKVPRGGVITGLRFLRDGQQLVFSWSDARHPRQAYGYDPKTGTLEQWAHAELGVPEPVDPTHETIRSFDGTEVHALVYRPAKIGGVVIELHGGPEDRFVPAWDPWAQALVARGYAVVQANVRGSTGYGTAYAALDDREHRGDAIRDVGAVIDWAAQMRAPIAVMGTSYGGMLALDALASYGDKLAAGIALSPITDIPAFLSGTADYRANNRRAEYGDERDPAVRARLAAISPIARAGALKVPMLIAHGARDPRVPVDQVDRFVATARKTAQVWYARADDEGHVFSKTANRAVVETLAMQLLASAFRSR